MKRKNEKQSDDNEAVNMASKKKQKEEEEEEEGGDNDTEHIICLDDKNDEEAMKLIIGSKAQTRTKDNNENEKPRTLEELANSTRDFTEEDYETLLKLDEDKQAASLTAAELDALPRKYLNKCDILGVNKSGVNSTCCICCNKFVNGDYVRILPGCGHFFHTFCIDPWLSTSIYCPVDRMDIREELKKPSKKNNNNNNNNEKSTHKKNETIEIIEID